MHSYEDRLRRVIRYIYDNPAGDLSLDTLADVAAFSRFHWHRVFLAMTGETCAEAVRRVRATRAAHWLRDHPKAKLYIGFGDFHFALFSVTGAFLNGGFGKAFFLTPVDLGLTEPS